MNLLGIVSALSRLAAARAKAIVAHLSLDAARIQAISAGVRTVFEDLIQNSLMQGFSLLRGE
jgi:hypothetical protein